MDKKPKSPSLKKVARTYKKLTKPASSTNSNGAMYFTDAGKRTSLTKTSRTPNFKPKAKQMTYGSTKQGKGTTVRKKGRI